MTKHFIEPVNLISNEEINLREAISYQRNWANLVETEDNFKKITTIAGVDVAYDYPTQRAFAVVVVLAVQTLAVLEVQRAISQITIPYRSGFLSFREVPAIGKAIEQLSQKPDLLICDGQGIAHPRRFGLACHLGLTYDIPTIGCGKSRLYGVALPPGENRQDFSYLYDRQKTIIGCVLRTRAQVNPVYISIGHRVSLQSAQEWILKLTPKYRLPVTTRLADRYAHEFKIANL